MKSSFSDQQPPSPPSRRPCPCPTSTTQALMQRPHVPNRGVHSIMGHMTQGHHITFLGPEGMHQAVGELDNWTNKIDCATIYWRRSTKIAQKQAIFRILPYLCGTKKHERTPGRRTGKCYASAREGKGRKKIRGKKDRGVARHGRSADGDVILPRKRGRG